MRILYITNHANFKCTHYNKYLINLTYDFINFNHTSGTIYHHIGLSQMKYVHDKMSRYVTYYSSKYSLDDKLSVVTNDDEFMIIFFSQKICVIHISTKYNIHQLKHDIMKIYNPLSIEYEIIMSRLNTYSIFLFGDQVDINPSSVLFDIKDDISRKFFYGSNISIMKSTYINTKYSEHCGYVKMKILKPNHNGYDFDGVLHTAVYGPDNVGQRHAISNDINYILKNQCKMILTQIFHELLRGDDITIITARSKNITDVSLIENFITNTFLAPYSNSINIYYTSGINKTYALRILDINIFYDDSCLRIRELYNSMNENILPNLKLLYYVDVESASVTIVNKNIENICPI